MSLKIGEAVGDYQVIGLLGSGGMGSVYRVRNVISDREEALKVLLPDLASAPDLADRFMREIKIHASLEHPNIASLRTALRLNNQLLMIMELVNGETVERRLQRGALHPMAAVEVTTQVLAALRYAHERGVIHRDIKPGNIMVTTGGVVKLTDFGIASGASNRRLTQTGLAIGSLHYMSPEQIKAITVDGRSDIYSLGVTLYEMVTGWRAFEGSSDFDLMRAHLEQEVVPASSVNPNVPPVLSGVIARAMAKKLEDRFQRAAEFLQALENIGHAAVAPVSVTDKAGFQAPVSSTTAFPSSGTPVPAGWDAGLLDRVRKELAVFVGPVARVLVNRAAKKTQHVDQLYESLGNEIASWDERQKFMATRRRVS